MTWATFSELFLRRYFPDVIRDIKRMEFIKFEQGTLSVFDYETRFTAMSKFAKEMVSTENLKCRRFEAGLIDTIRPSVVVHAHSSYRKVVDTALLMEREIGSMSQTADRGRQTRTGVGSVPVPQQQGTKRTHDDVVSSGGVQHFGAPQFAGTVPTQ